MEATLNLMAEVRKDPIVFELPGVKPVRQAKLGEPSFDGVLTIFSDRM